MDNGQGQIRGEEKSGRFLPLHPIILSLLAVMFGTCGIPAVSATSGESSPSIINNKGAKPCIILAQCAAKRLYNNGI